MTLAARGATALAGVLVAMCALTACGADQPAVCSSIDDLSTSMDHLGQFQLGENARAELETQLAEVRADLAQVRTDAGQQYGAQVASVTQAASVARERLQAVKAAPSAATLPPLRAAITDLGTSIKALKDAVAGTC
jgi:hypothetical protein